METNTYGERKIYIKPRPPLRKTEEGIWLQKKKIRKMDVGGGWATFIDGFRLPRSSWWHLYLLFWVSTCPSQHLSLIVLKIVAQRSFISLKDARKFLYSFKGILDMSLPLLWSRNHSITTAAFFKESFLGTRTGGHQLVSGGRTNRIFFMLLRWIQRYR